MIQRIQSIYLFLIVVLSCSIFYLPSIQVIEAFTPTNPTLSFVNDWLINAIEIIIPIIALVSIFLFKKRQVQIKLSYVNIILIIIYYISFALNIFISEKASYKINISAVFPVISLILFLLAIRAIKNDENLVKSMDRLR